MIFLGDMYTDYQKWRIAYEGGRKFVTTYLEKFSNRETAEEFLSRQKMSYCPRFAGASIDEVKNSIYQRLVDIVRAGGPDSYKNAAIGLNGGVDRNLSTMTNFMGVKVLPELLVMGKVGIYVDREPLLDGLTVANEVPSPYLYVYPVEQIIQCIYGNVPGDIQYLELNDNVKTVDEKGKIEYETRKRTYRVYDGKVYVSIDDDNEIQLNLKRIPFVLLELPNSLMADIVDYQIALLNIESSDIAYILKSNFPFYVEQTDGQTEMSNLLREGEEERGINESGKTNEITVGVARGRKYSKGVNAPAFINPSSEPLKASMLKQDKLKEDIRTLLSLSLSQLKPSKVSAESKSKDTEALNAGLSYIGEKLQIAENQVAAIWADYEQEEAAQIVYPTNYELRSNLDRLVEAQKFLEISANFPSATGRKRIKSHAFRILMGMQLDNETLDLIEQEIRDAEYETTDYKAIRSGIEMGYIDLKTAAEACSFNPSKVAQAAKEQAERIARVQAAQTSPDDLPANKDIKPTPDVTPDPKPVRGENV